MLEAGKTPEPFPLSRPPFSLASLLLCRVANKHPIPKLREGPGSKRVRLSFGKISLGSGAGGRARQTVAASAWAGVRRGEAPGPRWARAWPAAAPPRCSPADRPRLAGTCHRHLPPLPTRTARGGGGGGGDLGERASRRAHECDGPRGRGGWFLR